ncbi:MAG: hypothetical protein AAGD35_13960 [Actinomycetota bacterium]
MPITNFKTGIMTLDNQGGSPNNYHSAELTLPEVNVAVDCALTTVDLWGASTAADSPGAWCGIARWESTTKGIEQWAWEPTGLVPASYREGATSVTVGVGAHRALVRMRYRLLYWEKNA